MVYLPFNSTCRFGQRLYSIHATPLRLSLNSSLLARIQSSNNVQLPIGPFDPQTPCRATSTDPKVLHKYDDEDLVPFFLQHPATPNTQASPIGFLRPAVAKALLDDHHSQLELDGRSSWSFQPKENYLSGPLSMWALSFSPYIQSEALRTDAIKRLVEKWKHLGMFPDVLRGELLQTPLTSRN